MIIPNMYNIKISCKDENDNVSYNIDIDTDVTVTATVLDFNGEPVIGKSLTIYYDDETSIYTGTTDSNGQISTTYTCAEWGTHIFSVETFSTSINVSGFKLIQSNITYALYVDESTHTAQIRANRTGVTIATGNGFEYTDFVIPTKYRPSANNISLIMRSNQFINYVFSDGTVGITNTGNTVTNYSINFIKEWHY